MLNWSSPTYRLPQPNQAVRDLVMRISMPSNTTTLKTGIKKQCWLGACSRYYIAPIRLYSGTKRWQNKYTAVKDIPENGSITGYQWPNKRKRLEPSSSSWFDQVGCDLTKLATAANIKETRKTWKISELMLSNSSFSTCRCSGCQQYLSFVKLVLTTRAFFTKKRQMKFKLWYNLDCC